MTGDDLQRRKVLTSQVIDVEDLRAPEVLDVLAYWDRVRGPRFAPKLGEFRLEKLSPKIVSYLVICDFEDDPFDMYYRFFGTRMVEYAGLEMTGKRYYADRIEGYGFINAKIFPLMIERRAPVATHSRWVNDKGIERETLSVRLPFSEDGERVSNGMSVNHFA